MKSDPIETFDNGVVVWQATRETAHVCNLYDERPYVSPDGRRFLYARQVENEWDYVLCEFGSWRTETVGRGIPCVGVSYQGDHYYARRAAGGKLEIVRIDLNTGASEIRFAVPDSDNGAFDCHPAVSADGRYFAFTRALSFAPQRFGVFLVDRETGACDCIHEDPYICNSHGQFCAGPERMLMIQHNRGCEYTPEGKMTRCVGEKDGCTLFLLAVPSGAVTRLPAGIPHSTPCTGHEAWIGTSDEIIYTVESNNAYTGEPDADGNIRAVRPGGEPRRVAPGVAMMHIGTTPCGRYFYADGARKGRIIVGSPRTGKYIEVCRSQTNNSPQFGQKAHTHVYLSPDFKWLVFNSDRTGVPQVYAASVPDGLLKDLE